MKLNPFGQNFRFNRFKCKGKRGLDGNFSEQMVKFLVYFSVSITTGHNGNYHPFTQNFDFHFVVFLRHRTFFDLPMRLKFGKDWKKVHLTREISAKWKVSQGARVLSRKFKIFKMRALAACTFYNG